MTMSQNVDTAETPPEVEAAQTLDTNDAHFGALAATLTLPGQDPGASDTNATTIVDPADLAAEAAPVAPAVPEPEAAKPSPTFDESTMQQIADMVAAKMLAAQADAPAPAPPAPAPPAIGEATPEVKPDQDVFAQVAALRFGEDAEHAPAALRSQGADSLRALQQWQDYAKQPGLTDEMARKAAHNIAGYQARFDDIKLRVQTHAGGARRDVLIARQQEELEAFRNRPSDQVVSARKSEYRDALPRHIETAYPALHKALAAGSTNLDHIIGASVDWSQDEAKIAEALRDRCRDLDGFAAGFTVAPAAPTTAPDDATPAVPRVENPAILAPGGAPGAATKPQMPKSNEEHFALMRRNIARPGAN